MLFQPIVALATFVLLAIWIWLNVTRLYISANFEEQTRRWIRTRAFAGLAGGASALMWT